MTEINPSVITISGYTSQSRWTMQFDIVEVVNPATPITKMRKVLTLIWRNQNAMPENRNEYDRMIQAALTGTYTKLFELYRAASITYQNGYEDVRSGRTPKEIRQIEAANKRMYNTALKAKRTYDRYKDRFAIWEDIKAKYPA